MTDITVILNAHKENTLAKPAINSLKKSIAHTCTYNISTEVQIILDCPDSETESYFRKTCPSSWSINIVNYQDPGLSRMEGIKLAKGKYCSFLDADDLYGIDWLVKAFLAAEQQKRPTIFHPEINVYFGNTTPHIFYHSDMNDANWENSNVLFFNPWTVLSFAERNIYLSQHYPKTNIGKQIGLEDWGWNIKTIANGILHKRVPNTAHFIRAKREASVGKYTAQNNCIPFITPLINKTNK